MKFPQLYNLGGNDDEDEDDDDDDEFNVDSRQEEKKVKNDIDNKFIDEKVEKIK